MSVDFEKYELEIRDPQPMTIRPSEDTWWGAEIDVTVQRSEVQSTGLALTVEEAYHLRDLLDVYLFETYEADL